MNQISSMPTKSSETIKDTSKISASPPLHHRLALLRAYRIIQKFYSSADWISTFDDIASRRLSIRLSQKLFEKCRHSKIAPAMLSAFGVLSSLMCSLPTSARNAFFGLQIYPNEHVALNRLEDCLSIPIVRVHKSITNLIGSCLEVRRLALLVKVTRRNFRLLSRKANNEHFLVLCQIANLLFSYQAFIAQLKRSQPKAVITSSSSLPEPLALVAAARALGIPSIYASHASIAPGKQILVPTSDIVLLDGSAALDACKQAGDVRFKYVYWGLSGLTRKMAIPFKDWGECTIGVFLTAPVDISGIAGLIETLTEHIRPARILIRPHPIAMLSPDLTFLTYSHPTVSIVQKLSLENCLKECDLVISSNSNVHREVLHAGIPSLYKSDLDKIEHDYWGFIRHGIVPELDALEQLNPEYLSGFYDQKWAHRFRQFDASYDEEPSTTRQRVQAALGTLLREFS